VARSAEDDDALRRTAGVLLTEWLAALDGADDGVSDQFRYLVAMVAVRDGILVEVGRRVVNDRSTVQLVQPEDGTTYAVPAPWLGESEAGLVAQMRWVLFGDAPSGGDGLSRWTGHDAATAKDSPPTAMVDR